MAKRKTCTDPYTSLSSRPPGCHPVPPVVFPSPRVVIPDRDPGSMPYGSASYSKPGLRVGARNDNLGGNDSPSVKRQRAAYSLGSQSRINT